jgi:tripartite-type tricarboxylate transporter receptor subunit TctC
MEQCQAAAGSELAASLSKPPTGPALLKPEKRMIDTWVKPLLSCVLFALTAASQPATAQTYPSGPVKVISDSAPGSAPDVILRIVADRLGQAWGQQVIVVNQPGAGGAVAARAAAGAAPNGSTLFMAVSSAFVTMKGAASNIPIEVPRDFAPITVVGEQPMFITITPAAGINTLPALIAAAKHKPGEITYAVSGVGRQSHLTGEMLQRRAGIKLLMVPYSGGPSQALGDLMGGRVQMLIEGGTALVGAMQSGKLRALAVGSDSRLAEFPDLPTVAETIPDFRAAGWMAMVAPAGTPEPIVRKVSNDLRTVLTNPEVRAKLASVGSYTRPTSPDDTTKFILNEQRTWAPVLDELSHGK